MAYSRLLLSVHILLCLRAGVLAEQPAVPVLPDCKERCGDFEVLRPFGIGEDCAHAGFNISCTADPSGVKRPFIGSFEVIKISVPDNKAWMKMNISSWCYDPVARKMKDPTTYWQNFTTTPFTLSTEDNMVFVIGCNTVAYMTSDSYVVGCKSTCLAGEEPRNDSCSGAGCCEVKVPEKMQYFESYFNVNYNNAKKREKSLCNYVVVMEKAAFNYSTSYIASNKFWNEYQGQVPAVMDWVIPGDNCTVAKTNMITYACVSDNSECVDYTNGNGYRCSCAKGYNGNPYIKDGCGDTDECLNKTICAWGTCNNTPGSFACSCPRKQRLIHNGLCAPNENSIWLRPVVGASVGLVVLIVAIACAYLTQERRKLQGVKQKYFKQHGGLLLFEEMKAQQGLAFRIFSEEELQQATNMFDEERVLGHGSHGTVYKGLINGGSEVVAVKRCMIVDEQQKKEFGKEMMILSQINHRNIVKLLGCCLEVEVPILVYEFIPNDTLFSFIHGRRHHITLATRLRIAHESAEALAYLHCFASPPILHGDVKSLNILLDGDYTAKVSDFGASILAPTDESQFVTIVQGTCGYLDPEYMQAYQLTDKSDVYSFGVVLLELITGKKAFNLRGQDYEKSLSMSFLSAMKEGKLEDMLDDQIKNDGDIELIEEIAELAVSCLEMCGVNRPSMKEVADKLDRLRKVMARHPWAQQSPQETESLLEESSSVSSSVPPTTQNFSIDKKIIEGLESGR